MSTVRLPRLASFLLPLLALLLASGAAAAQSKGGPELKKKPAASAPKEPAKPAAPDAAPAPAKPAATKGNRAGIAALKGVDSGPEENAGGRADDPFDARAWLKRKPISAKSAASAGAALLRLADHPKRDDLARWLCDGLRGKEIDVALLGGHKYMINDCLGVKASAGTFRLKLDNPSVRFENTGIVLKFSMSHVSISAIKIRIRPNPNVLELCSFSDKFEVGGSMEDVSLTLRFDPMYDLERCRIGTWRDLNPEVRIGEMNLKPLQNDLDRMAKNMIEDSLTLSLQWQVDGFYSAFGDLTCSLIDQFLEADCPTKPGDTAKAVGAAGRWVGGTVSGAAGGDKGGKSSGSGGGTGGSGSGGSGSGGSGGGAPGTGAKAPGTKAGTPAGSSAPSGSAGIPAGGGAIAPEEVAALLARIEQLEGRIAELEDGGGAAPTDLKQLLAFALEHIQSLGQGGAALPEIQQLLADLLRQALERTGTADRAKVVEEIVRQATLPRKDEAEPVGAAAEATPAFTIEPNPALKGRMGRIVAKIPDAEVVVKTTRIAVERDQTELAANFGSSEWEMLPGAYTLRVSGVPIDGCAVKQGCDTNVKLGALVVEAGKSTRVAVIARIAGEELEAAYNWGTLTVGLPPGRYEVEVQGQREAVVIRAGETTRF